LEVAAVVLLELVVLVLLLDQTELKVLLLLGMHQRKFYF
jgi:hypothetical protein